MTKSDRLFRYKAQLEANTGKPWPWLDVAQAMEMDAGTLRSARFSPDTVNVATLRRIEEFLNHHNVAFSVSEYLADAFP